MPAADGRTNGLRGNNDDTGIPGVGRAESDRIDRRSRLFITIVLLGELNDVNVPFLDASVVGEGVKIANGQVLDNVAELVADGGSGSLPTNLKDEARDVRRSILNVETVARENSLGSNEQGVGSELLMLRKSGQDLLSGANNVIDNVELCGMSADEFLDTPRDAGDAARPSQAGVAMEGDGLGEGGSDVP